jgi:single-stranded-DNA-specific exonuclease
VLLAKDNINGDVYKGSCRSVDNINITEALEYCSDILIKYGGHEKAAGLSVEYKNIYELDRRLNEYADKNNADTERGTIYNIECEVEVNNIDCETVREIESLEPFGCENPAPLFMAADCKIMNITPMGENKHIKIEFEYNINIEIENNINNKNNKVYFEAVYFNMEPENFGYGRYDEVDLACGISINEYMNRERVQYLIKDIKRGANSIPGREDFKSVYMFILNCWKMKKDIVYNGEYNIDKMYGSYIDNTRNKISRFKFLTTLDIFSETEVIYMERDSDVIRKIKINSQDKKINLEESEIYKKLKDSL